MTMCTFLFNNILPKIMDNYYSWCLYALGTTIICFILFFAVDSFFDRQSFKYIQTLARRYIKKAFHW